MQPTHRAGLLPALLGMSAALGLAAAGTAQADVTVYSNVANFSGYALPGGGATAGTLTTDLVADDITPLAGYAGASVTSFTFTIANSGSAGATINPTAYFYTDVIDALGNDAPGALLAEVSFNAITQSGGTTRAYTATSAGGFFALPAGTFFAGLSFSGAPAATLNNMGQGIFSPPTVGSSQDFFFQSDAPATGGSSPAGSLYYFGGAPVADFGWAFQVAPSAVPEASPWALLALGLLPLGLVAARRRRA